MEDFKGDLKKRMKFLIQNEEIEEAVEKIVQKTGRFPLPSRNTVQIKKQQEFYSYNTFLSKVPKKRKINHLIL